MKYHLFSLFSLLYLGLAAQEISESKRFMSLGEKQAYKIILPNQKQGVAIKLTHSYLKDLKAESVKPPKDINEIIYKNLFLKNVDQASVLHCIIEQEGPNVGWTGFFLNEKDTTSLTNPDAIHSFMKSIYNQSMLNLYSDSIDRQKHKLKDVENKLKDLSKDASKNDKEINNAKREIADAEKDIEKKEANIKALSGKMEGLMTTIKDAEGKLSEAKKDMENVNQLENTLEKLIDKDKEMNKRLKGLQKDPVGNANLIVAQNQDIAQNAEMVRQQKEEFTLREKAAKSNLKAAEKNLEKAKCDLKDTEKDIKSENKNIQKLNDIISKNKRSIDDSKDAISKFENENKGKVEEEIKKEKQELERLESTQNQYK